MALASDFLRKANPVSRNSRVMAETILVASALSTAFIAPVALAAETPNFTYLNADEHPNPPQPGFRITPYLQKPASDQMTLNFFGELGTDATVVLRESGEEVERATVKGELQDNLRYTEGERNQKIDGLAQGSWLYSNNNYKYSVTFTDLKPGPRMSTPPRSTAAPRGTPSRPPLRAMRGGTSGLSRCRIPRPSPPAGRR